MASSSSSLLDFVLRIADDDGLRQRFDADPDGTMAEAGLSPEDQEILRSRDFGRIQAALPDHVFSSRMASFGNGEFPPPHG